MPAAAHSDPRISVVHGAVARSQYLLLAAQFGRLVLFVAIASLLGRALDPADFGFYALVSSVFVVAQEILDMGTNSVATRQIAQHPADERNALSALFGWRRLLALLLAVACAGFAASGVAGGGIRQLTLFVAALGLLCMPLSAYYVVFQVRQAFGRAVLLGFGTQLAFLLASIAAIRLDAAASLIGILVVGREALQVFGSRMLAAPMLGYRLRARWFDPRTWAMVRVAWVFGVTALCYKLTQSTGNFIVWCVASPEALGSYGAASRPLSALLDMTWMFVTPLIAAFSSSARVDSAAFARQVGAYCKLMLGAGAAVGVCGWVLAPTVLHLLYGERYDSGRWTAVPTFQWLSVSVACAMMIPPLVVAELARHRERRLLQISIAIFASNVGVALWAVSRWGATGAAMASCATNALMLVALVAAYARTWSMASALGLLRYLVPAAVLAILLAALDGMPRTQLAAALATGSVAMILLWQLREQKDCRASFARSALVPVPSAESATRADRR